MRRWISPRRSDSTGSQLALDTAVRFLAGRPRSEYEVRRRLKRSRIDDTTIDAVVGQLRRHQLLDDAAFARYWVDQRQTFRPRGARLLRAELRSRGIDASLSQEAAMSTVVTAEEDAYRAATKRIRHLPADERSFKTRLSRWLAGRGFDWETVAAVVDRLWREVSTSSGSAPAPKA